MTIPENTARRDPLVHVAGSLGGLGGYVEEMEAAGQRQLVNSDRLPVRFNDHRVDDPRAEYERLGFVFGQVDPSDTLFQQAQLPQAWRREGSDHSMWSFIVDDLGRRRVSIFYKAAFYDRDAFMSLVTVHSYASQVLDGQVQKPVFDDSWCTPAAFVEALRKIRADRAETQQMYAGSTDSYKADRHRELTSEIAKIDDLIKRYA